MKQMLTEQNIELLLRLETLIESLSADEYTSTDAPVYPSCIGAHTRHILEHYLMFLAGLEDGVIDYDGRERDPAVENDRDCAYRVIHEIIEKLGKITSPDAPLTVGQAVCAENPTPSQPSTVGRELVFLHSHTTHHHSLIIMIMRIMGKTVSGMSDFAPSTIRHIREQACAR